MKFYTLTHISYNTLRGFDSLQSNLLLFSDKCDKIIKAQTQQEKYIRQHLSETLEDKNISTFEKSASSDNTQLNSVILKTPSRIHMLIVNEITAEPKTDDNIEPGDFVTLKKEAIEAIRELLRVNPSYSGVKTNLKLARVVGEGNTENDVKIMVCATNASQYSSTSEMGAIYLTPKSYLKKVYL